MLYGLAWMIRDSIEIIRPMALIEKATIKRFAQEQQFPDLTNPCPSSEHTKRLEVRNLLETLYHGNPKIKGNIFRALLFWISSHAALASRHY